MYQQRLNGQRLLTIVFKMLLLQEVYLNLQALHIEYKFRLPPKSQLI
jgi:hypothetical protein